LFNLSHPHKHAAPTAYHFSSTYLLITLLHVLRIFCVLQTINKDSQPQTPMRISTCVQVVTLERDCTFYLLM